MCEGGIKTTLDPKNSTAPGPRPPVLKFLDPPLIGTSFLLAALQGYIIYVVADFHVCISISPRKLVPD